MIENKTFYSVSRNAHVLFGLGITVVAYFFGGWKAMCIASASVLAFAAVKEAWWDEKYETKDECGSGTKDYVEYAVGVGLGLLLCCIRMAFQK